MASEEPETYLRLMAETELRRALALPKVRQRRHRRFPSKRVVRFAFHRLGLRRLSRVSARSVRSRTPRSGKAGWYTRRDIAIWSGRQHEGAREGLQRLAATADALAAVDAVDEEVAMKVIADQQIALELRQRLFPGQLHGIGMRFGHAARPASVQPSASFRAVGIAKRSRFEVDGDPAEVDVLTLVIGPDRAALTITAKRQAETYEDDGIWFLDSAEAVDNRGGSYSCGFSGGGDDEGWTGQLDLHPVPRAGVQWLDLTFVPGTPPIRIDLDQVTPPEPAIESLPRSELAARYLDQVAEQLFEYQPHGTSWSDGVTALLGVGLIAPDDPAISRLATLARRLGVTLPSDLAKRPDTELPERWLNVLDSTGAMDGPTGVAPVAAVLPEFDGSRYVLAGLRSRPDCAELEVLGWGARHNRSFHPRLAVMPGRRSWWARDSAGRWHVASMSGGSSSDTHTDLTLRFTPALHPAATSIDVVVTGKSGRVTVTLPVNWAQP